MRLKSSNGIMFHNFYNQKLFKQSPGSILSSDLNKIINKFGKKNIVDPKVFISNHNLKKKFCKAIFFES
tara:strand:+ start:56 stop:262 length:207 start_codon:yes stop_codon:yes gene_type:complete